MHKPMPSFICYPNICIYHSHSYTWISTQAQSMFHLNILPSKVKFSLPSIILSLVYRTLPTNLGSFHNISHNQFLSCITFTFPITLYLSTPSLSVGSECLILEWTSKYTPIYLFALLTLLYNQAQPPCIVFIKHPNHLLFWFFQPWRRTTTCV